MDKNEIIDYNHYFNNINSGYENAELLIESLLKIAEEVFGKRIVGIKFAGICFTNDDYPFIVKYTKKLYGISLTKSTLSNIQQFYFQLSHEIIHLLAPYNGKSNKLEEGMAVFFSRLVMKMITGNDDYFEKYLKGKENDDDYLDAYNLILEIMRIDKGIVKKVRVKTPIIKKIQEIDFLKVNDKIPKETIKKLLLTF